MNTDHCYHCGTPCDKTTIEFDGKPFCCQGCKTVYEILSENDLSYYYDLQGQAGATPKINEGKYDFLGSPEIVEQLVEFSDGNVQVVNLFVPHIHCSSCIWVLENLNKLNPAVKASQVDFPKKTVRITYNASELPLKNLVLLMGRIGYEPNISLADIEPKKKPVNRSLIYKLGIAGFAFGNVMFLSFPEYFDLSSNRESGGEFWLNEYQNLFRWLMFLFSLPVMLYSGRDYFVSAFKGLRSKMLNIDVPIALGILTLFLRSTVDIIFDWGPGFFDSLTGLIFFLLLGKFFQQKTYSFLSFERDYKSYFPIAVTRILPDGREEVAQVYEVKRGDRLLIRNEELIPADAVIVKGNGHIDYSFVTGEAEPVLRQNGDKVFAGGKQLNGAIEIEITKPVSQSYLTQLWGNSVFDEEKTTRFQTLTDSIGKRFTVAVLSIAFVAAAFWLYYDSKNALNVFTAVLIIACPCAIALAAPFTLGNMLRIFGRKKFYLKNAGVIERLAQIDMAIFDKTGTITTSSTTTAFYEGMPLTEAEESVLKNTLRSSNHPLSRALYDMLSEHNIVTIDDFTEHTGQGIEASTELGNIKVGSAEFTGNGASARDDSTAVHISANDAYKGCYVFRNEYRDGIVEVFEELSHKMKLAILSGDNSGEKQRLQELLPISTLLYFDQKPIDKLHFIKRAQGEGHKVMMVGDGLNDAGALAQADVGIAISEDINVFSPACDAILDASKFKELFAYIKASKRAVGIIKLSFFLSLFYNVIGLFFAVTGQLEPVIAAILMPLSSISVVAFTTVATNLIGRKLG
ncbi:heavy metal translocating P-type ATPase [Pseudozobellia thermophila]|nr:heavy metal translocating P-type ATPase metal-binding domain-containing protein [Pseudozobellia thermophila]